MKAIFGGSSTSKPKTDDTKSTIDILKTGGEVDGIVSKLLAHAYDKNEQVRISIACALHDIGQQQTELVLTSAVAFVVKQGSKLEYAHRVQVIRIIGDVLEHARDKVSKETATTVIQFATSEMVSSQEVKTDSQAPACAILVLLCGPFCDLVVTEVLSVFKPGIEPHYFVPKALAEIAAANGVHFTRRMGEVLGRTIPVLGSVKKSPMKWVFATALGRFAEAIMHFNNNADAQEKEEVDTTKFYTEIASAWDVIFTKWLIDKESKVRFAVAESLGYLSAVLDKNNFEDRLNKIIPQYFAMYKKEKFPEHQPISHGFAILLRAACKDESKVLEPQLSNVLNGLHPFVCKPPDLANPATAKNHNELLRCFEVCGRAYLPTVLTFVINRFQDKSTSVKLGSLLILRHFVNALDPIMDEQKPLIMSSVIKLVVEPALEVKKAILQLIVSMANNKYLTLEGGQTLVKYIVQQCALPADKKAVKGKPVGDDVVTNDQLRVAAAHILYVMSTKVPSTYPVLWPFLFELFAAKQFSGAVGCLARCLHGLGQTKREELGDAFTLDFKSDVNLPSPQFVFSRLMIVANVPNREAQLGLSVCHALKVLGPILNPNLGRFLDEQLPAHLEVLKTNFKLTDWEDGLLKLFKEAIEAIGDQAWLRELCNALTSQFDFNAGDSELNRVLFRYLGAVLAALDAKALVSAAIDSMIASVQHTSDAERQGCAQGLGLCGFSHLDALLPKLTALLGDDPSKKQASSSGGLFSFGKSGSSGKTVGDYTISTVLLSYGYITAYANPELILSRLDVHIMHNLLPVFDNAKTMLVKVNLIKSIDLIGKALHESRLPDNRKDYVLQQRNDLLKGILALLKPTQTGKNGASNVTNELRLLGTNAIATLINLNPPISTELRAAVFETVLPFYSLFSDETDTASSSVADRSSTLNNVESADNDTNTTDNNNESVSRVSGEFDGSDSKADDPPSVVMEMVMSNLNNLLSSAMHMDPYVPTLVDILQRLEKYLVSSKSVERERSAMSHLIVIRKFLARSKTTAQGCSSLKGIGQLAAVLLTRCNDSTLNTRQTSCENLQALLYVNQILGNPNDPKPAQEVKLITEIRNRLDSRHLEDRVKAIADLSGLVCTVLPIDDLMDLLTQLLSRLEDIDEEGSVGAAEFLKGVVAQKASAFGTKLEIIVGKFVEAVRTITRPAVCKEVLFAFRALAKCHFEDTLKLLLRATVPLSQETSKCFVALVNSDDQQLALDTIKFFFTILNDTPMDADKPTPIVMAATCGLAEVLQVSTVKPLISGSYAALFSSLLMRVGTAYGVDDGRSSTDAVFTLTRFLEAMNEEELLFEMKKDNVFVEMTTASYDDATTKATRIFCGLHGDKKRSLLKFLAKFYSQQSYNGQRVVATSLLAEFVNHSGEDLPLLKELIKFLLPRVVDKIDKVRKQALRGLGNLVKVWSDEVIESATSVLSALASASEDTVAEVAAEAVASMTRIVAVVDEDTIGPNLINICFRMRPAFDRKAPEVRAAAFGLFGGLCRFGLEGGGGGGVEVGVKGLINNFIDQLHTNIPIYVVHLNDEDDKVRECCLLSFKQVALLLDKRLKCVIDEGSTEAHVYDNFVSAMCPLLGEIYHTRLRSYVDGIQEYFNSPWMNIRGNAAFFAGNLLASAPKNYRGNINSNALVAAILNLLKHENPLVRSRAAKAVSLLYDI